MAFGDNLQVITSLDETLDRYYDKKERIQFHRLGKTARWFNPAKKKMTGKAYEFPCYVQPADSSRWETFASARTSEFPAARDLKIVQMAVTMADMRMLRGTCKINDMDQAQTEDPEMAVTNLAERVIDELDGDFSSQLNLALFQAAAGWIAKVHTFYNVAGTSNGDTATGYDSNGAMFIRIKNGPIAGFNRGDVLEIMDVNSTTTGTKNVTVTVNDVIASNDGPPIAGTRQADIGPGLVCTPTTGNWNTTAVPASGDYIVRSGEFDLTAGSGKHFHGFPDWFDTTVDVYRNEAGSVQDREAAGNAWMNPEVFTIAAAGSEVAFDPTEHLRDPEDVLHRRIETGRMKRQGSDGPAISDALVLILPPEVVNEGVRAAQGTEMFTATLKMGLSAAQHSKLFGESGFDGFVYHSPTLGTLALQADEAMPSFTGYIIEPNSWFWLTFAGSPGNLNWVMQGSSRWIRLMGDTLGTPTFVQQASAYFNACLVCDQPAANVMITGIKSSAQ